MRVQGMVGWVLAGTFGFWLASGTQREKPVLGADADAVRALENAVAHDGADAVKLEKLAQAYLAARAPGLALSVIEHAPPAVRDEPRVLHAYARALLDQGRAAESLMAERRVLARCSPPNELGLTEPGTVACDAWLFASATRRRDIVAELVQLGIEDANAHPEGSAVAYHNVTREVRLALR